ncbi:hypothetical protein [Mesorhizobium sp. KR9-304]|uniref:hypothetical protein n=1 Tax=Mesorhizobium sp. KR9-304 TaxID=3156614 RepID=UPI0032B4B080
MSSELASLHSFYLLRRITQAPVATIFFARRYPAVRRRVGEKKFVRHSSSGRVTPGLGRATARMEPAQMNDHQKNGRVSCPEFDAWVRGATPGSTLEYHLGNLAVDADPELSEFPEPQRQQLCDLRDQAFSAAAAATVDLVQRRIGPNNFSYLAIARRRRPIRSDGAALFFHAPSLGASPRRLKGAGR